jgi:alpha/beta superfamily hydrolase
MISGGRLRFRATIKRESNSDNLGKRNKTFATTVGTFRCDLRDVGATEGDYSLGVAAVRSYEIHARWQAVQEEGLLETDRLVVDGMTFNINGIRNEGNRDRLAIIDVTEVR